MIGAEAAMAISTQELTITGLVIIAAIAFALGVFILVEWVSELIENYGDGLEKWHITERRDDSDRH